MASPAVRMHPSGSVVLSATGSGVCGTWSSYAGCTRFSLRRYQLASGLTSRPASWAALCTCSNVLLSIRSGSARGPYLFPIRQMRKQPSDLAWQSSSSCSVVEARQSLGSGPCCRSSSCTSSPREAQCLCSSGTTFSWTTLRS
uniref:Uncharacterized protein n=1 Tax=Ixodes ricinus TaxID=34613 RepID=A0A6B0UTQ9_IXORI